MTAMSDPLPEPAALGWPDDALERADVSRETSLTQEPETTPTGLGWPDGAR